MDSTGGHLLALKVMRISRPRLLGQWQPFVGESTAFDAYNASSATSMQHTPANPSVIPSTVRDFNTLSPNLALPNSFGSISLGETFASCLCITNQTHYEIEGVHLRVEMQSAASKAILLELGGPDHRLAPSGTLEGVVQSEIKELGQHTLSCIVHYRVPPGLRPPAPSDDPSDPRAQLFRKHYRFPVSNPFSVKTKVHTPKSPTALMSRTERERVFLEVHVQNLTQEPLWFERLDFRPVDGWSSTDGNALDPSTSSSRSRAFCGPGSLVHPQDTFQYLYTLTPATIPSFPSKPAPGTVIPLGRLDMAWRSNYGEPGRLLTSMLSRKVPAPPPTQAPSALPPHLQRAMAQVPRPRSPTTVPVANSASTSRSSSPAPYKSRQPNRPQTPVQTLPPHPALPTDVEVDLVVDEIMESDIQVEEPFSIRLTATAAAFVHSSKKRSLTLAAQHVIYSRLRAPPREPAAATAGKHLPNATNVLSHAHGHSPTPSGASTPRMLSTDFHTSIMASPKKNYAGKPDLKSTISLPSPYSEHPLGAEHPPPIGAGSVEFLGNSLVKLPPFELTSDSEPMDAVIGGKVPPTDGRRITSKDFTLEFLPVKMGHANVGGVRLLLLTDEETDVDGDATTPVANERKDRQSIEAPWRGSRESRPARVLHEWPVIAEVWVASG